VTAVLGPVERAWSAAAPSAALLAVALVVLPGRIDAVRRVVALLPAVTSRRSESGSEGAAPSPMLLATVGGLVAAVLGAVVAGAVTGLVGAGVGAAIVAWLRHRRAHRAARTDPWDEAGAWDRLAACLRAGLPLERAARAVVPGLAPAAGAALTRMADLLALGADPTDAWEPALAEPTTARLARAGRRSARSGAAVADVAEAVAVDVRADAGDTVAARAERAGVLVTGPLGLCFLPAFLALGIVPVVIGLAGPLLEQR